MASPFRLFRKHMKVLLVVFGVLIMFVFVVGDYIGRNGGGPRERGNAIRDARAVAVRWDGGRLTNAELEELTFRRRIAKDFVLNVWALGEHRALERSTDLRPLRVDPVFRLDTPATAEQGVEQSVVETRLFADAARNAGMRVSDETIRQHLLELGRGYVSADEMRAMLNRLQMGAWRVTTDYVFEAIREEMLARNYSASHRFDAFTVTPQQRWEDWLSVNDRVVIEAAAIPVQRFVADVPEPSEAELVAFFEQHKEREPAPDTIGAMEFPSPTPGFAIPRKIGLEYIAARYDDFLEKVEDQITEEEIAQAYEENKEHFIRADTSLFDDLLYDDEMSTEEADVENDAAPTNDAPPADEVIEPKDAVETETDEQETPAENAESDEATPGDADQSSREGVSSRGPFRLAAFQEEEAAVSDDVAAVEEAVGESAAAEEGQPMDPPAEAMPERPEREEPAVEYQPLEAVEYQPLEEVRDVIRRELAEQRAAEEMTRLMSQLTSRLSSEYDRHVSAALDAETEKRPPPPLPPLLADLPSLAEEHGLAHDTSGPLSWRQMREMPVGRSGHPDTRLELYQILFATRDLDMHQPTWTSDIHGNQYISMKVSDTPRRVPALEEVRDEVVHAWKLQQAAELAQKHADDLATKAKEAGTTLADFFAADATVQVVRTDPFSKLTGGEVAIVNRQLRQEPFRYSQPEDIVAPGPEFLQRVFDLRDNEVAAVMNHDRSVAYVVRVVERLDSPEQLRAAFLAEATTWDGMQQMLALRAQGATRLLMEEVAQQAGLRWERPADQIDLDDHF